MSCYELTILAQDTTNQPLNGTAHITISVLDYNDNAPQFDKDSFSFKVQEATLLEDSGGIIGEISVGNSLIWSYGDNMCIFFPIRLLMLMKALMPSLISH